MIQRRVLVSGRVQGVFFRAATLEEAQKYPSLCGFVRNRDDGTVEALFAGDEKEVESMISWCKKGPPRARVSELKIKEEEFNSQLKKFYIDR